MKLYKSTLCELQLKRVDTSYQRAKISSSKDGEKYFRNFFFEDLTIYESFFLLTLNNANNTTGYVKISQGGITGTLVDMRIVLKYAIENLATSIMVCHNHPSGNINPSEADKQLTKKLKNAVESVDIKLLDHIILTEESYYSFADEGLL